MKPAVLLIAALLAAPSAFAQSGWSCPDYASEIPKLLELEEAASVGSLSQEQKDCLEKGYAAAKEQTSKNKISRVLLVNAYAYDTEYWAKLVIRHLDEVDQSDPNVAYLWAFYLYNRPESPDFEKVIYWIDIALERKQIWETQVYVKRVNQLMKVRTLAAAKMWQAAADKNVSDDELEKARNRTKTFAREWIDFAKSAKVDATQAEILCISAASADACGLTGGDDEDENAPE